MVEISGMLLLFVLIGSILAFLLPFFVLRIRNEIISINKKLSTLIDILSEAKGENTKVYTSCKKVKTCKYCGFF